MLPHALGAVCDEPAIQHPAGQGEAQVHLDVIIHSESGDWWRHTNKTGNTRN